MAYKLAISNIAWPSGVDEEVLPILDRHGVKDIEIAPSKIWTTPSEVDQSDVRRYRNGLAQRGFRVVAAQALLFGRPDLTIFENAEIRSRTLTYLDAIIRLCADLGAKSLVFGSPRNRQVGDLPAQTVWDVAITFFGELADIAERYGTVVVMEANPPQYQADFVTRAADAADLVARVNRPGLRLHLDTACMNMVSDDIASVIRDHSALLHHFHISEPNLAPVSEATIDHGRFAESLGQVGYDRWVSIEMRAQEPFKVQIIDEAIVWARQAYDIRDDGGR